jgi:hypothetical protein
MPRQFNGPPLDLANMRSLGVRLIFATCGWRPADVRPGELRPKPLLRERGLAGNGRPPKIHICVGALEASPGGYPWPEA